MSRRKEKPESILLDLIEKLKKQKTQLKFILKGKRPYGNRDKTENNISDIENKIYLLIKNLSN